jgi:hypothetical protein
MQPIEWLKGLHSASLILYVLLDSNPTPFRPYKLCPVVPLFGESLGCYRQRSIPTETKAKSAHTKVHFRIQS